MKRVRRGIEADIGADGPFAGDFVEPLHIRALMEKAAFLDGPQEVGTGSVHGHFAPLLQWGGPFSTIGLREQ